ncbi:MAG: hypothetical protein GX660_21840, partial [Clostridiaceae bacterium]|nr:hypothetical protein [Clostridiaceae bacterium]
RTNATIIDNVPGWFARNDFTPEYDGQVVLGISTAAESLNSYEEPSSGLTKNSNLANSVFNTTTRKLITTLTGTFKNNTAATINITESGIIIKHYTGSYKALHVRDVFAPIPVEPGKLITWTYVTEVAYPEP